MTCQQWYSGTTTKYFNIRFVKAHEGWRYFGSVHEWPKDTKSPEGKEPPTLRMPEEICLYQDRTQDDDKTAHRFNRDKILLLKDHKNDRKEPRTLFYLAQTCACLRQFDDALYYYKLLVQLEGFQEEKFHAYLRAAEACEALQLDWSESMSWYMRAF